MISASANQCGGGGVCCGRNLSSEILQRGLQVPDTRMEVRTAFDVSKLSVLSTFSEEMKASIVARRKFGIPDVEGSVAWRLQCYCGKWPHKFGGKLNKSENPLS